MIRHGYWFACLNVCTAFGIVHIQVEDINRNLYFARPSRLPHYPFMVKFLLSNHLCHLQVNTIGNFLFGYEYRMQ